MGLLNKEDMNLLLNELSSLKTEISSLHEKVNTLSSENENLKNYIQKESKRIIDNQIIIHNALKLFEGDYFEPTHINAFNTANWVHELKERKK